MGTVRLPSWGPLDDGWMKQNGVLIFGKLAYTYVVIYISLSPVPFLLEQMVL